MKPVKTDAPGGGLMAALGMEILSAGKDRVRGRMPVDDRTRQPRGLLHGGASAAFAETLASLGAALNIEEDGFAAAGVELNASHLRAVREGWVHGEATPARIGRKLQVWEIRITDDDSRLVCLARLTVARTPAG